MCTHGELTLKLGRAGSFPAKPIPLIGAMDHLKPRRGNACLPDGGQLGELAMRPSDYCSQGFGLLDKGSEGIAGITVEVEAALEPDVSERKVDDFGLLVAEFGLNTLDEVAAEGIVVVEACSDDERGVRGEALPNGLGDGVRIVFGDVDGLKIGEIAMVGLKAILEFIRSGLVEEDEPPKICTSLGFYGWKAKLFEQYNPMVEPLGVSDQLGIVGPFADVEPCEYEMLKVWHRENPA
jgi:hypothetical protein